jgi:hypothetical protein
MVMVLISMIWNNYKMALWLVRAAPFAITEVDSKRAINCKAAKREGHTDLIIRNYA